MNTLRQMKGGILAAVAALVIIALAFFGLGRITSPSTTTRTTTPTTPALVVHAPHVLGAILEKAPSPGAPSYTPSSFTITTNGPFLMVATCNEYGAYADTPPTYFLQVFTTSGHLLDTVKQTCDPSSDRAAAIVVPEQLAAGQYQVVLDAEAFGDVAVIVLDASSK
jgi:hypothetical protein